MRRFISNNPIISVLRATAVLPRSEPPSLARAASTVSMPEKLKFSNDRMARDVASHLLTNYEKTDIDATNKLGFSWTEIRRTEGPHIGEGGLVLYRELHGTDVIYAHACCNPKAHRDRGPWETEIKYGSLWKSDKSITKAKFIEAGFTATRDDGPDKGDGGKALDFENKTLA